MTAAAGAGEHSAEEYSARDRSARDRVRAAS